MEWVDEDWAVEARRNNLAILTDFSKYVESMRPTGRRFNIRKEGDFWLISDFGVVQHISGSWHDVLWFLRWYAPAIFGNPEGENGKDN